MFLQKTHTLLKCHLNVFYNLHYLNSIASIHTDKENVNSDYSLLKYSRTVLFHLIGNIIWVYTL